MWPGFTTAATAIAVILSAIVRGLRTGAAWAAVEEGVAGAEHLRDLTGILEPRALQDIFGPPRMDGVYPVTRAQVLKARRPTGMLMGDRWLDRASLLIALAALLPIWPLWTTRPWLETLVACAGVYQALGWAATLLLLGRR